MSTTRLPASPPPCTVDDVAAAHGKIRGLVRHTPVIRADVPTPNGPVAVHFKLESLQLSGSFKIRGSLTAVLAARARGELPEAGVDGPGIAIASGGNAAIAAAQAASILDVRCVVVVPTTAPTVKVDRLIRLGAEVHQVGSRYLDSASAAVELADARGDVLLHAYDLPEIVAGAGTIGLELREQIDGPIDHLIAVGGGGLIAGVAATARDQDSVTGVEPVGAATLHAAMAAGRPVPVDLDSIAADSLGATQIGEICWATCSPSGPQPVRSLVVSDDAIVTARRWLWDNLRMAVENGTAAALVPVMSGAVRPQPGRSLGVLLCGANTSISDLDGAPTP